MGGTGIRSRKIVILLSLLIFVICYLGNDNIAININSFFEMLKTGNTKGLMMHYYSFGKGSYIESIITTFFQTIIPIFSKPPLVAANIGYFGVIIGFIITVLGTIIAKVYSYIIGTIISDLFKVRKEYDIVNKYAIYVVLICTLISTFPFNIISYLAGVFNLKFKTYIVGILLADMFVLSYIILA